MQSELDSLKQRVIELLAENAEIKAENVEVKAENAKLRQAMEENETRFVKLEQSDKEKADYVIYYIKIGRSLHVSDPYRHIFIRDSNCPFRALLRSRGADF